MLNEDASGVLASDFVACIVSVTALIFFRGQMYVSLTVTRTSSLDGEAMMHQEEEEEEEEQIRKPPVYSPAMLSFLC